MLGRRMGMGRMLAAALVLFVASSGVLMVQLQSHARLKALYEARGAALAETEAREDFVAEASRCGTGYFARSRPYS